MANYTEEDKEILSAMGMAEDDSTINDESESEEDVNLEEEEEISEEEETEESESEEEEETEEASQEQKPKKGIAKVLAQRNEARKEAEEAKKESEMLKEELERLKGDGKGKSAEYMETLVKQQLAEREEISEYFEENEELRPYKAEIKAYAKEKGLPFEESVTLYLGLNHPELLLDKQTRNRKTAKMYDVPAHTSQKVKSGKLTYSDDEFDKLVKAGKITL